MAGLLDEIRKSEALAQVQQRLQGLLNIPTAAQQFMVSPASFMGLLGRNPLPRETGFAAGATGLPAQEMSVLDPNQAPYMQGYSQGEPVGYAGLALPLAAPAAVAGAKALGPKAGQALESYMVNQGMIQPLTAYHGTPHTIQGKFDINKVGTGEGAQSYGYGMYFAENPAVAKEYQKLDPAGGSLPPVRRVLDGKELQPGTPEYHAGTLLSRNGVTLKDARSMVKSWIDDPNAMSAGENTVEGWKRTLDTLNSISKKSSFKELPYEGNLYKVDIPDEYIPNMLDWEKPLKDQPKSVQKALAKIDPDLYSKKGMDYDPEELGQMIYQRLSQMDMNKNGPFTGAAKNVSEMLNSQGIKGIRYSDAGSRGTTGGTSNFVVFDPADVKILEKNSEKVEGLLD